MSPERFSQAGRGGSQIETSRFRGYLVSFGPPVSVAPALGLEPSGPYESSRADRSLPVARPDRRKCLLHVAPRLILLIGNQLAQVRCSIEGCEAQLAGNIAVGAVEPRDSDTHQAHALWELESV